MRRKKRELLKLELKRRAWEAQRVDTSLSSLERMMALADAA